jgi:hypothetical protein
MEVTAILELMKGVPEGTTAFVVIVFLIGSFFLKKKDVDLTQVTSISKLQTDQLTTLIEQNKLLAGELHAVRKELTEAYKIMDDMRQRITELEEMLRDSRLPDVET